MPKRYRVLSQAKTMGGHSRPDVFNRLVNLKLKPEQANTLLTKNIQIKAGLDKARALALAERFANAGLAVKLQAYEVAESAEKLTAAKKQKDAFFALEAAFRDPIPPRSLTKSYRLALSGAVLASLLAPLIYAGVLALATGALWWYFSDVRASLASSVSLYGVYSRILWFFFTLVLPAAVGSILILFLLYPLWPTGRRQRPLVLDPKRNAQLYQLVGKMTQAMGVPAPRYIEIDADMNAAAGPVHGLVSLLRGELRLVVGLSLVAGTTVQEFVGVMAHEFGHFAQRSSMFTSVWVNTVNRWLGECAFGHNVWSQRIERWQEEYEDGYVQVILSVAAALIWVVRALFVRLFILNVRITQALSQQMEFDADRYEAHVSGSAQFRSTTCKLRKLGYAHAAATELSLDALHEHDRLLRNIPRATQQIFADFPVDVDQRIQQDLLLSTTNYWDSHPADNERILNAEQADSAGLIQSDFPASSLFNGFEQLCEQATMADYFRWGIHGAKEFVVDNTEILNPAPAPASAGVTTASSSVQLNDRGVVEWPGKIANSEQGI